MSVSDHIRDHAPELVDHAATLDEQLRRDEADAAFNSLLQAIRAFESLSQACIGKTVLRQQVDQIATRLLKGAPRCFRLVGANLSPIQFRNLMVLNPIWSAIRIAGDDGDIRRSHADVLARFRESPDSVPVWERQVVIATSQLAEMSDERVALLQSCPRWVIAEAVLDFLFMPFTLTREAEDARTRLIGICDVLQDIAMDQAGEVRAANAWFCSSYAEAPNKHDIKAALNIAFARRFAPLADLANMREASRSRPVMAVAIEAMTVDHVNFRCYAGVVRQLRDRFHTVLVARPAVVDDAVRALFHEVVEAPDDAERAVASLQAVAPDVLFYPTLGLAKWTIIAANRRIAPVQIISLGCPATSRSPHIDYAVHGQLVLEDADCFSEKLVRLESPGVLLSPHPQDDPGLWRRSRLSQGDKVRIALRAEMRKLNGGYIDACLRIQAEAATPCEFHLFPFANPFWLYAIGRQLRARGLNVIVHPRYEFPIYLRAIAECDLSLSPFPFGNAVSTLDALLSGVPVVAMKGREPHARTDLRFMKASGLEEWVFDNVADYCAGAVRLIDSSALRESLSDRTRDLRRVLFEDEHRRHAGEFAAMLDWIHRNHDAMQASSDRSFGPRDWSKDLCADRTGAAADVKVRERA